MADISKINPNGTEYNLKDASARAGIESSKTLKSSVVTVTDAAAINAEDITVDLTPVQDLHGYDRPWAGGAGKNKLPMTVTGIKAANTSGTWNGDIYTINNGTIEILTDSADNVIGIKTNGTFSAHTYISLALNMPLINGISYVLNGCPEGGTDSTYFLYTSHNAYDNDIDYGSGVSFTATITSDTYVRIAIRRGQNVTGKVFYPMIRLATETDATFAPYSNICPIEGRTGAELDRVGKNWFDKNADNTSKGYKDNTYLYHNNVEGSADGWYISEYIRVPSIGSITLSGGRGNDPALCFYDADKHYISGVAYSSVMPKTFSIPSNSEYIRLSVPKDLKDTLQVELGAQPTAYEPYQGQQYAASFGETVHGGKWHVTKGGTDKTHANIASYNGETINEPWLSSLDEYVAGATPTTGAQVVYPLTTPTTISTPKQNVPMLQGINTVSADCGDTSLKYQPDNVIGELKGEIEDNIIYEDFKWTTESSRTYSAGTPGTYGCSSWRDVKKEGYDVIGVTFVGNRRFGDCILTLNYIPSTNHVEVIIFRATSSAVTIADEDIVYRVAYKKH